jgi:hypothetical protein
MIDGKKQDMVRLRQLCFSRLISGRGHGGQNDFAMRKFFLYSPQEGNGAEDFPNGSSMDPDGTFKGLGSQKTHSLDQWLSEPFLEEASDQKVRRGEDEQDSEKGVVEEIDHHD